MPSGPASLDKSQPGGSQHPLPAKEEPRAVENDKPVRPEDGGLDAVATRTVVEHVPIKQEPLVATVSGETSCPPETGKAACAGSWNYSRQLGSPQITMEACQPHSV